MASTPKRAMEELQLLPSTTHLYELCAEYRERNITRDLNPIHELEPGPRDLDLLDQFMNEHVGAKKALQLWFRELIFAGV